MVLGVWKMIPYEWICSEILNRNNKFMEDTSIIDAIEILMQMSKEQESEKLTSTESS